MAKDNIKRFPRPMGTTAMAAEYQRVRILKIYKGIQLHYQSLVDG